jgi:hypothetical protein
MVIGVGSFRCSGGDVSWRRSRSRSRRARPRARREPEFEDRAEREHADERSGRRQAGAAHDRDGRGADRERRGRHVRCPSGRQHLLSILLHAATRARLPR